MTDEPKSLGSIGDDCLVTPASATGATGATGATLEDGRLRALEDEQILDTAPEPAFDDLVLIAATALDVPIAAISFFDRDRQWFKARVGVPWTEIDRHDGPCRFIVEKGTTLVVPDVNETPIAAQLTGFDGLRAFAGVPLMTRGGHIIGVISVGDMRKRQFTAEQVRMLEALARQTISQLHLRRESRASELEEAVRKLRAEIRERQAIEEALRRSQEQLVQSQKLQAVGQLAGGIAHEFNNILTVIFGYLSVLELDFEQDDPRRGDIRRIAESADRAALLTRQLLAFSRHQRLTPQLVDLNQLLGRQERMLARIIGDNVRVVLTLAPQECPVRVDPAHVEQVILNLAINARDAMPDGGTFSIETVRRDLGSETAHEWGNVEPGDYVAMVVTDNGHGMPPDVLQRVFEPFFTTKEVGKGTGLGLSTVYGIVAQSGGHIRVVSTLGEGTTFTVLLPLIPASVLENPATAAPHATPRGSETVLLVEDEQALRDLAASILRRHGYWVIEASNGLDALALAARQPGPIHLLLTDVVMPGMTGGGLARRLLPTRPDTRVLYMSGYTNNPESLGLGPDSDFIGKPFTPAELLSRVRSLLDRGAIQGSATT